MADIAIENDWKGPLIVDFPIKNREQDYSTMALFNIAWWVNNLPMDDFPTIEFQRYLRTLW